MDDKHFPISTVAMLTHVPFWRRADGAQQRMWSLYQFMKRRGACVTILSLAAVGSVDDEGGEPDAKLIPQLGLDVRELAISGAERNPGWLRRLRNRLGLGAQAPPASSSDVDRFYWDEAATELTRLVEEISPQLLIVEYVALARYAKQLRAYTDFSGRIVLDSHDVMHQRCARFADEGAEHWLTIDRDEESSLLVHFDMVLAIQEHEATTFREMCPQVEVVTAGHSPEVLHQASPMTRDTTEPVVIGFLGSDNLPNRSGLRWFLTDVWPLLAEKQANQVSLLLAGGCTESIADLLSNSVSVTLWPQQIDVSLFYRSIDIAINPVQLGTGLKIKSVEALSWGVPLVTTAHSAEGLPAAFLPCTGVTDDAHGFAAELERLVTDESLRAQRQETLLAIARHEFSESTVYADFARWVGRTFE